MNVLEPITLIAPINDCTLYCKNPRIIFNLNDGNDSLVIYVTLSNNKGIFNYTSTRNPELFSKITFKAFDKVSFIPKDTSVGENTITIRVYDNQSFSSEQSFKFNYKECLLAINNETELITGDKFRYLYIMTQDTLKAYNKAPLDMAMPGSNFTKIYKNYFSNINNSLYDLNNWINENYPGLNRIKTKDIIGTVKITKKIYNNILNFITDL